MEIQSLKGIDQTIQAYKRVTISSVISALVMIACVSIYAINKSEKEFVIISPDGRSLSLDKEGEMKIQAEIFANYAFSYDRMSYEMRMKKAMAMGDKSVNKLKGTLEKDLKLKEALERGYIFTCNVDSTKLQNMQKVTAYLTQNVWADGQSTLKAVQFEADIIKNVSSSNNQLGLMLTNIQLKKYENFK